MNTDKIKNAYLQIISEENENFSDATTSNENRLDFLINQYESKGNNVSKQDIIELLNIAYMDEWLAEFNYFASWNLSKTEGKKDFDEEFQAHEEEERAHRKDLVNRLRELGAPVPTKLLQEFFTLNSNGEDWKQELSEDSKEELLNRYNEELGAIKFYSMFFKVLRRLPEDKRDTTTEMLIKKIKGDEEEHAKDLKDLLVQYSVTDIPELEKTSDNETLPTDVDDFEDSETNSEENQNFEDEE